MNVANPNNETYSERQKSNVVTWLRKKAGLTVDDVADVLGISVGLFNNNLVRNSFKLEEIVSIADACGYSLVLLDQFNNAYPIDDPQMHRLCGDQAIGTRVQAIREAFGWTQVQLAEKIGTTSAAVSAWELGTRGISTKHLNALSKAFSLTTKQLLGDSPITENDACMVAFHERTQSISQKLQCT